MLSRGEEREGGWCGGGEKDRTTDKQGTDDSPSNITRARVLSGETQNAVSSERGGALINIEPMLEGEYVKHNDNDGHVDSTDLYPQACSL